MKTPSNMAFMMGLLLCGLVTSSAQADAGEAELCGWTIPNNARWCAIGDSITHGGDWTRYVYLYLTTRFPGKHFDFINRGIGGDTALGALDRFDWDIAPDQPTVATVMFGVNDSWWQHFQHRQPDAFIQSIAALTDRLKQQKSSVLLIAPPPYDQTAISDVPVDPGRQHLPRYVEELRQFAAAEKLPFLDFYGPMQALTTRHRQSDASFSLMKADRTHPNEAGNFVMAYLFLRHLLGSSAVSELTVDGGRIVKNSGMRTGELKRNNDQVELMVLEDALPFPGGEVSDKTLELVAFMEEFNREMLRVTGLAAGRYELLIDDQKVGLFAAEALAEGINLAGFETPQMLQAREVARLNLRRHEVTGPRLRGICMIEHGQLHHRYPIDDVAAARKEIDSRPAVGQTFEHYLRDKAQESQLMAEGQQLVSRIFQEAQPRWHQYRIRRVSGVPSHENPMTR